MASHRFTDKWIQALQAPTSGRLDYADALCPCLHLRISHRGTKSFSVTVRAHGQLQRRTLGTYPSITLAAARSATRDLVLKLTSPSDSHTQEPALPLITYADAVDIYTERHLKPNTRSWKDIRASLLHARLEHLRGRPITSISKRDIIDVVDSVMASGSPQAAVNILRRLKMLFNWHVDRDNLASSPCDRIRAPARTVERDRTLTNREIASLWRSTFFLPAPYGQMYRFFFLTGQRRTEVAAMTWDEISNDVWTIARVRVKKDRAHTVPLSSTARQTLATLPRYGDAPYIFTTTGGKRPSSNFAKVKRRLDDLSGVSGWTIHDIRRTVRSKLAELGVSREVARKILNHEDSKVDRIYNRYDYLAEKRKALDLWQQALISLAMRESQPKTS